MKIEIVAYPGIDGADVQPIVCPTWVRGDLAKTREWALKKARQLSPPIELVELLSEDGAAVRELWRPEGDHWVQDDA